MTFFHTIILGIVEGVTEFLPVSSTFHLIWTSRLLGLEQTEFVKLFEVVIQSGAILAVVLLYWKEVLGNRFLIKRLIQSFIPTAGIGLVLYDIIKGVFFETLLMSTIVFIAVGGVFILIEWYMQKRGVIVDKGFRDLTLRDAVLIGIFQAMAVIPGVSRAGAVLVGMMILGYRRDISAKYSFMLAIPTIGAATVLDLLKMKDVLFTSGEHVMLLGIGTLVSFVSAYFGVSWFITYLQKHTLTFFGWYRIGVGIILVLMLLLSP